MLASPQSYAMIETVANLVARSQTARSPATSSSSKLSRWPAPESGEVHRARSNDRRTRLHEQKTA